MKKEIMPLPNGAEYIIERLEQNGYRADAVGGCVRDFLLGRECQDFDITTNATPSEIKRIFLEERLILTGLKHGTVTIVKDGANYEVTTYRIDGEYKDNRHPQSVEFTKELAVDLSRRDFTINALCYSKKHGFTDDHEGILDIQRRLVRAVGDAEVRFTEDALRILRAIRFASVLGFNLEEKTALAVHSKKKLLLGVSSERIYSELMKLIGGVSAYRIFLDYSDVICTVVPQLKKIILPRKELFESADARTRLIAIFALSSKNPANDFLSMTRTLKTDKKLRDIGLTVLQQPSAPSPLSVQDFRKMLYQIGLEATLAYANVAVLCGWLQASDRLRLESILSEGLAYRISDLKIGGKELMSFGIKGAEIGKTLEELLLSVIEGKCENTQASLIRYVTEKMGK